MQGQDIALLLQLALQDDPRLPSKSLAENLAISPSEVSKALRRCVDAGLLYIADGEKRVNRPALMEFLAHGLRYVWSARRFLNQLL
jgi:DNA-binding transcriptional regulator YhcF (GntR family)